MGQNQSSVATTIPYFHNVMFSLNLALASVAAVFLYNHPLTSALFRMDASINRFLHIRQTDLVWGYWAFFLSGILLALCIWVLLRLFSRIWSTEKILESFAGIAALAALPVYWLCSMYSSNHRSGWDPFHSIPFYEILLVLICVPLYLRWNWRIPLWGSIVAVLLHYAFWFQQFGTYYIFKGNGGPIILLPIVGLMSALTWVLYIRRLHHHRQQMAAP
jgi:hypothetical protein